MQLEETLQRHEAGPPHRRLQRRLENSTDTASRRNEAALAELRKENLVAYIAECHKEEPSIQEACHDYAEWQDFWSTRLLDDTAAQKHAHEACGADEQRDFYCFLSTLEKQT